MISKAEGEQKEHHEAKASEVAVANLKGDKSLSWGLPKGSRNRSTTKRKETPPMKKIKEFLKALKDEWRKAEAFPIMTEIF